MTDTYQKPPRRPLVPGLGPVPGPNDQSIAARAVALREQKGQLEQEREAVLGQRKSGPLPTYEEARGIMKPEAPLARPFGPVGNIAGAVANVMANIGTIEKGGFNAFHKYHYARMEDLLVVLTPLMGQNGLAVIQNEVLKEVLEGNRLAVTYEFSIFHKSGEFWPERPRFTGMSIARDSRGNWDDKAINKCHTNARKYFLLALFQVPAGDFDEADSHNTNQRQEQQPVPGPKSQVEPQPAARTMEQPREDVPGPSSRNEPKSTEVVGPHKIVLGQGSGAEQWADTYVQAIGKAKDKDELKEWDAFNSSTLESLYRKYPDVYSRLIAATERRLSDLGRASINMPSDTGEAINWIAEQLQTFKVYEYAEQFWNQTVAPFEISFDPVEWEMLMDEWRRTEKRLAPDAEPPEDDVATVQGLQ